MSVVIKPFTNWQSQMCAIGKCHWSVPRLIQLSKDLPVMIIPMEHLNIYHKYDNLDLRKMVGHFKAINAAELKYPIILDEDGEVMDGRHRIMKALLENKKTIKAVRFQENPSVCYHDTDSKGE